MGVHKSGLAFIHVDVQTPVKLFKRWYSEVADLKTHFFQLNSMCLATATREGKVSNRSVLLKEASEDGFVFVTHREGRKNKEIEENPFVATTLMWNYQNNGSDIVKQVRIEGGIHEISRQKCQEIYDVEKFYCKIRMHLCQQDKEVNWQVLSKQHDVLAEEVLAGKNTLPMPDYYVGYQIVPERMDFYYAFDNYVGDRVVFTKSDGEWKYVHVAA